MTDRQPCSKCGEKNELERTFCWVCYTPLAGISASASPTPLPNGETSALQGDIFGLAWILEITGLFLVFALQVAAIFFIGWLMCIWSDGVGPLFVLVLAVPVYLFSGWIGISFARFRVKRSRVTVVDVLLYLASSSLILIVPGLILSGLTVDYFKPFVPQYWQRDVKKQMERHEKELDDYLKKFDEPQKVTAGKDSYLLLERGDIVKIIGIDGRAFINVEKFIENQLKGAYVDVRPIKESVLNGRNPFPDRSNRSVRIVPSLIYFNGECINDKLSGFGGRHIEERWSSRAGGEKK